MSRRPKPRRYAQGTKVPVAKTKVEIDTLLARHGATQRAIATDEHRGINAVMFTLAVGKSRRQVRMELAHSPNSEAQERRAWRVLHMLLKMKLELINNGESTVDAEFLPNVVLPDGRTVLNAFGQQLDQMYRDGAMPPLLGPAS